MNDWDYYMSVERIAGITKLDTDLFLAHHEFCEKLRCSGSAGAREFLNRSRAFADRLVDVKLEELHLVSAVFLQGIYSFCPELLLEGDDQGVFQLFSKLLRVFERSRCSSSDDANASSEQFTTFVVDARDRHPNSGSNAEEMPDVVQHLLYDYSFAARRHLCRVLKLCCLVLDRPHEAPPRVVFDFSGCDVPSSVISLGLSCVQSYVSASIYEQGAFFNQATMDAVLDALAGLSNLMADVAFDPWSAICIADRSAFVSHYTLLFENYLAKRKKEVDLEIYESNRRGRQPCISGGKLVPVDLSRLLRPVLPNLLWCPRVIRLVVVVPQCPSPGKYSG